MAENLSNIIKNITNNYIDPQYNIILSNTSDASDTYNTLNIMLEQKKILKSKYQIMGIYDNKIFSWSYDMKLINKDTTIIAGKIKKYRKELKKNIINNKYKNNSTDIELAERLYYYISHSNFYITDNNIDDLLKISKYITNYDIVQTKIDNVQIFYFLTDILTIYNNINE